MTSGTILWRAGCSGTGTSGSAGGPGNGPEQARHRALVRPNQFDVTEDGRAVKLLYVVDEFTREALAMEAERRIDGDKVVDVLDRIVAERGTHPEFVRCDNGPEMTSHALRDWCRFSRTGAAFIEPGSPWENPFVESFNSRVRDELLGRRGVHAAWPRRR